MQTKTEIDAKLEHIAGQDESCPHEAGADHAPHHADGGNSEFDALSRAFAGASYHGKMLCLDCCRRLAVTAIRALRERSASIIHVTHKHRDAPHAVRVVRRVTISATRHIVIFENYDGTFGDMTDDAFDAAFEPANTAGARL